MSNIVSPSNGADRARRYRGRKKEGRIGVPVEVGPEDLNALIENFLLEPKDLADRGGIGRSVELILHALSEGAFEIDFDYFLTDADKEKAAPP